MSFSSKYRLRCDNFSSSVAIDNNLATAAPNERRRDDALHAERLSKIEMHQFSGLAEGQIDSKKI